MGVQATDGFLADADLYALADEAVRSALMPGDRLDDLRDDLRHEAILGVLRAQRVEPGKSKAYYAAAARSAVTDAIRRELAQRGYVRDANTGAMRPAARRVRADVYELADQPATGEPDPLTGLETSELGARAMAALQRLPDDWRRAVELRVIHGQNWTTVACTLGCSVNTAHAHLLAGLAALKRAVADETLARGEMRWEPGRVSAHARTRKRKRRRVRRRRRRAMMRKQLQPENIHLSMT